MALLTEKSIAAAAKRAGVHERTLRSWMHEDAEFRAQLEAARRTAFDAGMMRIQTLTGKAIDTLAALLGPKMPRDEARQFLAAAKAAGAQPAALYTLALETGMRKGELCGLGWKHVDLEAAQITVDRQLTKPGPDPLFGPTKNGRPGTVPITSQIVELLRAHKRRQAELKMANRGAYPDHGLVFAKEYGDLRRRLDKLGHPLQSNHLGERSFARLCTAAGVKRITFHGLRHTSATLLLADGEPVHVVSERLGHRDVSVTLNVYAHALPLHSRGAADRIGALLYGSA